MIEPLEHIMRTAGGYTHAIPLLTACATGIFGAIGRGCRSAAELAQELNMDQRALETVLLALAADGFLVRDKECFRVTPGYDTFLLPEGERTRDSILNHHAHLVPRWMRLAEVLRTGKPAAATEEQQTPEQLRHFICGMANISRESSIEAAEELDASRFRRMLDLGGGPGTAAITFAKANPALHAVVFDLPDPIQIAQGEIADAGMRDRVSTMAGDFMRDDIGSGFDLVYVSNIVHMLSPHQTEVLLRKCHGALVPGGTVVVKEFFLDDSRASPNFAAFFSINMLVNTEGGKSYTRTELEEILGRIGFAQFDFKPVATESALLIAKRK